MSSSTSVENSETNGEDRISNLPEGVIGDILSCLPTRDAVRTSVLSKDWEFKWTSIYKVVIDDGPFLYGPRYNMTAFLNYVDRILNLSQNIREFYFNCFGYVREELLVRWISALLKQNVESLEITIDGAERLFLPANHLNKTSLRRIGLSLPCTLKVFSKNYFPYLTSLCLDEVKFLNEPVTDKVLLTFSLLETLELVDYEWPNVKCFLEIDAPQLTKFTSAPSLVNDWPEGGFAIKVLAPRLVDFRYCGGLQENVTVTGSSVVRAAFNLEDSWCVDPLENTGLKLRKLLEGFQNLEELKLSNSMVEAFAETREELALPRYDKLQRLTVDGPCHIKTLFELLHAAPFLKSLTVREFTYPGLGEFEDSESVPSCVSSSLEKVVLNYRTIPISDSLFGKDLLEIWIMTEGISSSP